MSEMRPVLHPKTAAMIDSFITRPSHAVLLAGEAGLGQELAATYMAAHILGKTTATLDDHPHVRRIAPEDGTIKIDRIRAIQNFYALKVAGRSSEQIRRIVIIDDADTMSSGAQNAFLKLLEEPPQDTVCILTTTKLGQVLPTIRSRSQIVRLLQPSLKQAEEALLTEGFQSADVALALRKTDGNIGKARDLLQVTNDASEDVLDTAKSLLKAEPYERLLAVDALSKDKTRSLAVIGALNTIARAAAHQAIRKADAAAAERWSAIVRSTLRAQRDVSMNGNLKLILSELLITL